MKQFLYRQTRQQLTVWVLAWGLLLMALLFFLELAEDVWLNEAFGWDTTLIVAIHGLRLPVLDVLFRLITETAGMWAVLPVLATAVYFWRQQERTIAALFIASFGGAVLFTNLLKLLFFRPRPMLFLPLVVETGYSFPSGHTLAAIGFYGLLALILWQRERRGWAALAGVWVLLVAISRVYLGAHYPSDVLASLAVGIVWLVIVWLAYIVKAEAAAIPLLATPTRDK